MANVHIVFDEAAVKLWVGDWGPKTVTPGLGRGRSHSSATSA
jgi:hypothetical protein